MADCEEMNLILRQIECINDSIVSDASAKTVRPFQPMMWIRRKPQANLINFCFDSGAKSWR
jgi:hypothetical protein